MNSNRIKEKIITRFMENHSVEVDPKGYLTHIQDNLISGITISDFKEDLLKGRGNELGSKFLAVYSSSALAVNHFAYFKSNLNQLKLFSYADFTQLIFEEQLLTGLKGTPPNLDVYLENSDLIVGIESKYLEHTGRKKVDISPSYCREKLNYLDPIWFDLIKKYSNQSMFLDAAQLIKHSIGLTNRGKNVQKAPVLLYLFWEPDNYNEFDLFKTHRNEVQMFSDDLKKTNVTFIPKSYSELWDFWDGDPQLKQLSHNLRKRFSLIV